MSCAQLKGSQKSVWRCSADLVSGAQVQCEVRLPGGKAKTGTSCGGTLAVTSHTLSY
jgi:hypothetical protein